MRYILKKHICKGSKEEEKKKKEESSTTKYPT